MTPSNRRDARSGEPARVNDGATPAAPARAWSSADIEADILSEACRPGVGEPVAIHVRPAVYARMRDGTPSALAQERRSGKATCLPFVIDDRIPSSPGYEIHRAVPTGWTC